MKIEEYSVRTTINKKKVDIDQSAKLKNVHLDHDNRTIYDLVCQM